MQYGTAQMQHTSLQINSRENVGTTPLYRTILSQKKIWQYNRVHSCMLGVCTYHAYSL